MSFENHFQFENPKELSCRIDKYWTGHSELFIRVMNQGLLTCYLFFYDLQFLSAPMNWKNANFYIATRSECQSLLMNMGYPEKMAVEDSKSYFTLYKVSNLRMEIQILARGVERFDYDVLAKRK